MMKPTFKHYDQIQQKIILEDCYLFAFGKSDGFNDRLLSVDFLIDKEYRFLLYYSCYAKLKTYSKDPFELKIEGIVPEKIYGYLQKLLHTDCTKLNDSYFYTGLSIDDIGQQVYLINQNGLTKNILIIDGLPKEYFDSAEALELYAFNEYLKDWTEKIYLDWTEK